MDLYLETQAQKARRVKRRDRNHLDKHSSLSYLRKRVQADSNPVLEQRLHELEVRASSKKRDFSESRKTFYAQEKNRLQAERSREESTHLMYQLIPGKRDETEQLAPRTFLHDGVLYRLKRNGDDFRVYANRVGDNSKITVRGNVADLESVAKEMGEVHDTLSYDDRVKQAPNSPKPTSALPTYSRATKPKSIDNIVDISTYKPKPRVEKEPERTVKPTEEDLGYLVPIFDYVNPALEAMGVKPMVVGFQRVDSYGNPILTQRDYGLQDEDQLEDEAVLPARQPSRTRKYVGIAAGIALAIASAFNTDIPQSISQPKKRPQRNQIPVAASLFNDGKPELYITDSSGFGNDYVIHEIRNLPKQERGVIYTIRNLKPEKRGLETLNVITNSNE